ncbi:sensor domain-containing diguanylate cyclase [Roseicyclus marinus]|uniref:sensor domain-containing diguanylate cyclase n=1 Tax=Roseicyclus marinus TaxID=2161673 RepID=UPI00240FC319|nr:sensor domain-containing diguanylate cyclase [Roseicyclus marinus]MDG3039779.1 sensor domain-containing diguanylate cyclase [Roseicyclus marinus]
MNAGHERQRLTKLRQQNILDSMPETEFDAIVDLVQSSFGADMAAITFIDEDRQWIKASHGIGMSETPRDIAFCDHTIRTPEVMRVNDATRDARFANNPLVTSEPDVRCYMGAPIAVDGFNIGSVCILGTTPRLFSEAEARMLRHFAQIVASQIKLRTEVSRDALTGVLSRGAFFDLLDIAFRAFRQRQSQSCLVVLDIDRFKRINDDYGHPVGDEVLIAIAEKTLVSVRPDDRVGRIGGEEFGIVIRDVGVDVAQVVAERVRTAIETIRLPERETLRFSASFGVAALTPGMGSVDAWYAQADKALYEAKNKGRNRVELCVVPPSADGA